MYESGQTWFIPINGTTVVLLRRLKEHHFAKERFQAYVIPARGRNPEIMTVSMPTGSTFNPYVRTA